MNYELILMPEAERHLKEWIKSGQKKTLLKIVALSYILFNIYVFYKLHI